MPLRVSAIESNTTVIPELARIIYDAGSLSIIAFFDGEPVATVRFERVKGFRVLDEGDLLEFWPTCSWSSGGWLWEVHEGGWFDFESTRPGFIYMKYEGASEYLVTGENECVSVISYDHPVITTVRSNNLLAQTPVGAAQFGC